MSTVSNLSSSVRARYTPDYIKGIQNRRVYDQFCMPISKDKAFLQNASTVEVPYLSDMTISENTISETVDIAPQNLRDTRATITPTSRGDALQDSEKLLLQTYTDYGAARFEKLGNNMIATLEALCINSALTSSILMRVGTRPNLNAGTSTHNLSDKEFFKAANALKEMGCPAVMDSDGLSVPNGFLAAMHPDAYYDLLAGGLIDDIATYQDKSIWFNGVIGTFNGFQIQSSPFAKVFASAGADADSNTMGQSDTLSEAEDALDKIIHITTGTLSYVGRYLLVGTEETGNTFYPTNERVSWVSGTTATTIVGSGPNGGLKYDHPSGTEVKNNDSVYPVLFGGPNSLAKIYATEVGEYGEVVGPKRDGLLDQFVSLGWKWYGAYAVVNANWLVRGEYSSSLDTTT